MNGQVSYDVYYKAATFGVVGHYCGDTCFASKRRPSPVLEARPGEAGSVEMSNFRRD